MSFVVAQGQTQPTGPGATSCERGTIWDENQNECVNCPEGTTPFLRGLVWQCIQPTVEDEENGMGLGQTIRNKIIDGNYIGENGQQIMIQKKVNNQIQLKVNDVSANCGLDLTQRQVQNKTRLEAKLNNGKNAEIKVMPDTAAEKALQRLRLKNCVEEEGCSIELKEVGQGEQVKLVYEVKTQRQSKVLGLFRTRMNVQAQVDTESGEIIRVKKPWWAFLASEPKEE